MVEVADILKHSVAQASDLLSVRAADVLVRMQGCRTSPLGQRDYQCEPCDHNAVVFNSCGERHCCRCGGFFRYRWLVQTQDRLVPETAYLQIVFTVPDTIGDLFQHAPAVAYAMLMQTAARETMRLQRKLAITPGCIVVLHTWNQRLLIHVHVHVLIPVAGIRLKADDKNDVDVKNDTSIEGDAGNRVDANRWISVADRPELNQGDQVPLGNAFRASIIRRIKRLQKHDKLTFNGKHERFNDPQVLARHLSNIAPAGYRVFVQHAPPGCHDPATVVKYLARYVSGGPISDRRIVRAQNGKVTFLVRDNHRASVGKRKRQVEVTIEASEFVRRWSLHILPKGFVRVRNYGHASPSNRQDYLARCRKLLGIEKPQLNAPPTDDVQDEDGFEIDVWGGVSQRCPNCGQPMQCVSFTSRPSWREIMSGPARPAWYEP